MILSQNRRSREGAACSVLDWVSDGGSESQREINCKKNSDVLEE